MTRRAGINDDDDEREEPRNGRSRRPRATESSGPLGAQIHTTGGSRWEISIELMLNKETRNGSGYFVKCVRFVQDGQALETITHRIAPLSSMCEDPNAAANAAIGRVLSVLAACGDYQQEGEVVDGDG